MVEPVDDEQQQPKQHGHRARQDDVGDPVVQPHENP
jgi:hypothetical protein